MDQEFLVPTITNPILESQTQISVPRSTVPSVGAFNTTIGEYRRFELKDIFFSKVGISIFTGFSTFCVLLLVNPIFVQNNQEEDKIQCSNPNIYIITVFSVLIVIFMMVSPELMRKTRL